MLGPVAEQPLELLGDGELELVNLIPIVTAERPGEFLRPDVERGQVEGMVVAHVSRAPNRTVPNLIMVAPSSTAMA